MIDDLARKKLLIVGGAFQHCKLVEAAKLHGIITYVIDYLPIEKSPAKQIADFHYEYNITDYDSIIKLCQKEHIDGVLSAYLDACQVPYQVICERLHLPCFGTAEQFHVLTDKKAFKEQCTKHGIDVIPQYCEDDFLDSATCKAQFPIFVKPSDSRGSRGQTICNSFLEVAPAIAAAKKESKSGEIIIEKYMGGKQDFTLTYLVAGGNPVLLRTGDRYLGTIEDKMERSSLCAVSPSKFTDMYIEKIDKKVQEFIRQIGIKNGPVFMQGFIDGETVRFYDPGLRCPGSEFDRQYERITGINVSDLLVRFALTGSLNVNINQIKRNVYLNGKIASNLFLVLRPGIINKVTGIEEIKQQHELVSVFQRAQEGDVIGEKYDVTQRLGEFDIVVDNLDALKKAIERIYEVVAVTDINNNNMIFSKFDCNRLVTKSKEKNEENSNFGSFNSSIALN